jgi:flavodoxin I
MKPIGIFYGTDSGTTRLIAKKIQRNLKQRLVDTDVAKPVNVNRISAADLAAYDLLILGTPTYGEGVLPGKESQNNEESWLEFLPQLEAADFTGKKIALFGLGDQEQYPEHFLDAMMDLYQVFSEAGATMVGSSAIEGFEFVSSRAVINDQFVGLALDQHLQHLLTDQRIDDWLEQILPVFDE